uniref:glutathione transferase n=1 Tax=Paracoccus marginatus TaxID=252483 RepID=A0AA51N409_9HEMI|nr:GSTs1 [Paracoccus marginatus]
MTTYKLTYFPIKALGEQIRFLLSYGGVDFIDDRFDENDWPKIKKEIDAHFYEDNAEVKAKKFEASKELVPFYIGRLDEQVKKNGGYFVGGKLTWADIVFVAILDYLNAMQKSNIIEKAENLKALKSKVLAEPKIKAWVDKRPVTEF